MQNYAPFQAEKGDTRANVQERVLEYYNNRLFQLAQPVQRGAHWTNRNRAKTAAPAADATTDSSAPAEAAVTAKAS
jgi:hypothetical protein